METKSNFLIGIVIIAVTLAAIALGMSITNVSTGGDLQTQVVVSECLQPYRCLEGTTWSCTAQKCVGGITPIFKNACISSCAGGRVTKQCREGLECLKTELETINGCASACADSRRVVSPITGPPVMKQR